MGEDETLMRKARQAFNGVWHRDEAAGAWRHDWHERRRGLDESVCGHQDGFIIGTRNGDEGAWHRDEKRVWRHGGCVDKSL
jgi:hypothetical protein